MPEIQDNANDESDPSSNHHTLCARLDPCRPRGCRPLNQQFLAVFAVAPSYTSNLYELLIEIKMFAWVAP